MVLPSSNHRWHSGADSPDLPSAACILCLDLLHRRRPAGSDRRGGLYPSDLFVRAAPRVWPRPGGEDFRHTNARYHVAANRRSRSPGKNASQSSTGVRNRDCRAGGECSYRDRDLRCHRRSRSLREFDLVDTASGTLLDKLLVVNILLVAFNMIPAFPMDGGRVLRALLATQMRYSAATRLAARIGQVIAVLFGLASLTPSGSRILGFGGPMLGFIAIFVFLGAQQELAYAQFRETAQNLRVGQAMITRFQALPISLRVGEIAKTLSESNQGVFPFVDEQLHFRGIASREELQRAATQLPPEASASSVARTPPTLTPSTGFGDALELMQQSAEPLLPVVNASGQIVGLLGLGQLAELSALRQPA